MRAHVAAVALGIALRHLGKDTVRVGNKRERASISRQPVWGARTRLLKQCVHKRLVIEVRKRLPPRVKRAICAHARTLQVTAV